MAALFGEERAASLRGELEPLEPHGREATIVNALAQSLKTYGHRYVLPFTFRNESGSRTSHHLILVTKAFKGYEVMKDIMAVASSSMDQGVPSFQYLPASSTRQTLLFELTRPLDDLRGMLLKEYAGRTVTMRRIYEEHSVDRAYLAKNYKNVLAELEKSGSVQTRGRRSSRGFADDIVVTFPKNPIK
jgi:hypothetical protein